MPGFVFGLVSLAHLAPGCVVLSSPAYLSIAKQSCSLRPVPVPQLYYVHINNKGKRSEGAGSDAVVPLLPWAGVASRQKSLIQF